mgnify:CR=1 FL=1
MKLLFLEIECDCCGVEMRQNQLEQFEQDKYRCPNCKTEIEIITEEK